MVVDFKKIVPRFQTFKSKVQLTFMKKGEANIFAKRYFAVTTKEISKLLPLLPSRNSVTNLLRNLATLF